MDLASSRSVAVARRKACTAVVPFLLFLSLKCETFKKRIKTQKENLFCINEILCPHQINIKYEIPIEYLIFKMIIDNFIYFRNFSKIVGVEK